MTQPLSQVVTANHLLMGDVIYLTPTGAWTRDLNKAEVIADAETSQDRLQIALSQPDIAVGAYLAQVRADAQVPEPAHFREVFRARGPSNYAHGKQASSQQEPKDV